MARALITSWRTSLPTIEIVSFVRQATWDAPEAGTRSKLPADAVDLLRYRRCDLEETMSRPATDKSGEPLEVLTLRVPARHMKLLDLLALGMTLRSGKPVGRGEALRRAMAPVFDALEANEDVRGALSAAEEMGVDTIRGLRLGVRTLPVLPGGIEQALDALGVVGPEAKAAPKALAGRGKPSRGRRRAPRPTEPAAESEAVDFYAPGMEATPSKPPAPKSKRRGRRKS